MGTRISGWLAETLKLLGKRSSSERRSDDADDENPAKRYRSGPSSVTTSRVREVIVIGDDNEPATLRRGGGSRDDPITLNDVTYGSPIPRSNDEPIWVVSDDEGGRDEEPISFLLDDEGVESAEKEDAYDHDDDNVTDERQDWTRKSPPLPRLASPSARSTPQSEYRSDHKYRNHYLHSVAYDELQIPDNEDEEGDVTVRSSTIDTGKKDGGHVPSTATPNLLFHGWSSWVSLESSSDDEPEDNLKEDIKDDAEQDNEKELPALTHSQDTQSTMDPNTPDASQNSADSSTKRVKISVQDALPQEHTQWKKRQFFTNHIYKQRIKLERRIRRTFLSQFEGHSRSECWIYRSQSTYGQRQSINMGIRFSDVGQSYSLNVNVGHVIMFLEGLLTEEHKRGIIEERWHSSHLCGNWRCLNAWHRWVEPCAVNQDRKSCCQPEGGAARRACTHDPSCMRHLKIVEEKRKPKEYAEEAASVPLPMAGFSVGDAGW